MLNKVEKLIITGKSGSGKDWAIRELKKMGVEPGIKSTTRPRRNFESCGIDYNFITEDQFRELKEANSLICSQEFTVTPIDRDPEIWKYGIKKSEFKKCRSFILTPAEISQLPEDIRKECFVIYLDIDRDIRESRVIKRGDLNDSVKRRLDADDIDFSRFEDFDLRITDPEFDVDMIIQLMN